MRVGRPAPPPRRRPPSATASTRGRHARRLPPSPPPPPCASHPMPPSIPPLPSPRPSSRSYAPLVPAPGRAAVRAWPPPIPSPLPPRLPADPQGWFRCVRLPRPQARAGPGGGRRPGGGLRRRRGRLRGRGGARRPRVRGPRWRPTARCAKGGGAGDGVAGKGCREGRGLQVQREVPKCVCVCVCVCWGGVGGEREALLGREALGGGQAATCTPGRVGWWRWVGRGAWHAATTGMPATHPPNAGLASP